MQATAGHPARGRFSVSRQVSWLAGRRRTPSSQRAWRASDVESGETHCLQLRGQRRNLTLKRNSPASLLATKSCDGVDRDDYIWRYSRLGVNGSDEREPKFLASRDKPVKNPCDANVTGKRVDARAMLPVSEPVVVLRKALFPELRGKPVRPKKPKPELPPQL